MKSMIKNTLILTAITLVSGLLLGLVYEVTKEPIANAQELAKKEAYQKVMSDANEFEQIDVDTDVNSPSVYVEEVVKATSGEKTKGYVITTVSKNGYGGDIQIAVGISSEGIVSGIEILQISETAGLGMNAQKEEFRQQYVGKEVGKSGYVVTKQGAKAENEIDAITSATVTSNAVTEAVNAAVSYYYNVIGGSVNE